MCSLKNYLINFLAVHLLILHAILLFYLFNNHSSEELEYGMDVGNWKLFIYFHHWCTPFILWKKIIKHKKQVVKKNLHKGIFCKIF